MYPRVLWILWWVQKTDDSYWKSASEWSVGCTTIMSCRFLINTNRLMPGFACIKGESNDSSSLLVNVAWAKSGKPAHLSRMKGSLQDRHFQTLLSVFPSRRVYSLRGALGIQCWMFFPDPSQNNPVQISCTSSHEGKSPWEPLLLNAYQ